MFRKGDLSCVNQLRRGIHTHHMLFGMLYKACLKTKIHMSQHCVDSWVFWKRLLSCFGPERKHKIMKMVGHNSYNRFSSSCLYHTIKLWMEGLMHENAFESVHLCGTIYDCHGLQRVWMQRFGLVSIVDWSQMLRTPLGLLGVDDLVMYKSISALDTYGIILAFARIKLQDGSLVHVIGIQSCAKAQLVGRVQHWRPTSEKGFLASDQVERLVPFVKLIDTFVPASQS